MAIGSVRLGPACVLCTWPRGMPCGYGTPIGIIEEGPTAIGWEAEVDASGTAPGAAAGLKARVVSGIGWPTPWACAG
eukprot:scaffold682137_cov57-Prasinocladus_malaysianus.AAC.1